MPFLMQPSYLSRIRPYEAKMVNVKLAQKPWQSICFKVYVINSTVCY